MQKYQNNIVSSSGTPVISASISVTNYPSGTAATIYSDNGVTLAANPLTSDSLGNFSFYAADGRYSLSISGVNVSATTLTDILLEDPSNPNPISATTITATGTATLQSVTATSIQGTSLTATAGGLTLNSANAGIEIGSTSTSNTPFIDFHSSGNNIDFDVRMISNGGSSTSGLGSLTVSAAGGAFFTGALSATGGINSTTIGATTPSTGAFTTLNVTGSSSVVSPTGSLGYGIGAGGTVTQATSKATTVTLNKPTGQITTFNDSLAAGASVVFNLVNSMLSTSDVLMAVQGSGGANGAYLVQCIQSTGGFANIRITNLTGGALAEAITINFAIIKGATA